YYVAGVYKEKASGARADRPELLRLIGDLQPGEIVVAEKIDRISRLPLPEAEKLVDSIRDKGAKLSVPGLVDLTELTRPHDKVFFQELDEKYRTLRIFLPKLLAQVQFQGNAGAKQVLEALDWMSSNMVRRKVKNSVPLESVSKRWMPLVMGKDGQTFNFHAYTFSTVDNVLKALKRRDIFIE
ncbi:recombinase family protein, partial [Vibrio sp. 10N.261.46.E12]